MRTKVLIVDDSIVFRSSIQQALSGINDLEILRTASNGEIAVSYMKKHTDINLITLDMEMPVMNGLETIKAIREFNKDVVIIVFSSLTLAGAEKTLEALRFGANDFVTKTEFQGSIESSIEMIRNELLPKIEAFHFKESKKNTPVNRVRSIDKTSQAQRKEAFVNMTIKPKLICIGSSTGGPEALATVFRGLDKLSVPLLIVQHMPPLFTKKLAEALDKLSPNQVLEAKDGDQLQAGVCYIAPGDYHMELDVDNILRLNQKEKVCYVRPSVDVLFRSVAKNFNAQVLSIVLTGMGGDGANGILELIKHNCYVATQTEESCVVYGMPRSVDELDVGATSIPLTGFSEIINKISKRM